ncbi:MAG: diguanylate cyclase [Acidimicrobiales bacterium]
MQAAPLAKDEPGRLLAVRELRIVDSEPEDRFDRIVQLAARLTEMPIAIMSLVDEHRVSMKSVHGAAKLGIEIGRPLRDDWFCAYVVARGEVVVVTDARSDDRFCPMPLVTSKPGLISYAGVPIRAPGGEVVGALGVFDIRPRSLNLPELRTLKDLATLLEAELASLPHAMSDALTGTLNLRTFEKVANRLVEFGDRVGKASVIVRADVVGMEAINAKVGLGAGDQVLAQAATLLAEGLRRSDIVGRLSSDEFVVLLFGTDSESAGLVVERVMTHVRDFNKSSQPGYEIAFHIGMAVHLPGDTGDVATLILTAEPEREVKQLDPR